MLILVVLLLINASLALFAAALSVCREEASRKCHNGMCLSKSLSCDGVEYCSDGSTSDVLCRECGRKSRALYLIVIHSQKKKLFGTVDKTDSNSNSKIAIEIPTGIIWP